MSDVEKAAAEAVQAAQQSEQYALLLAAVQAAQQRPACHHQAPAPVRQGSAGKWVAAGVGGSVLLLALAVSAVAVAISAVALTVCLLVLRNVWQEIRADREERRS
ncbi:hypothetical protein [Streptomyces sp. DH37]|uniref:hypothetical protein n=1 Tax=Streptomyces sp. DH37 TaxID=3040122 RepID=UPI002440F0C1|nr:hypothetical protein [Streptomyces sp. DH37]MDG9705527.1 hypothetical protein [Streptomyces sp. DH37]